jgi:hypothetical protein
MPRYNFNVVVGDSGNLVRDSYGLVCTNIEEAKKEAIGLACELEKQGFLDALGHWKVTVSDQNGQEVLTRPPTEIRCRKLPIWSDFRRLKAKLKIAFSQLTAFEATAALVTVSQVAITVVFIIPQTGNYQTASAPTEDGLVAVRFVPHASSSEINEFLKEYDASFVGGPSAGGFYRILIAKKPLLTRIVGRIAQEKIVDFAAAVQ